MARRAATPQGRKLNNMNNMLDRRYLPSINFSVPFARYPIVWIKMQVRAFEIVKSVFLYCLYFSIPNAKINAQSLTLQKIRFDFDHVLGLDKDRLEII
jgi:hypothetical protein